MWQDMFVLLIKAAAVLIFFPFKACLCMYHNMFMIIEQII